MQPSQKQQLQFTCSISVETSTPSQGTRAYLVVTVMLVARGSDISCLELVNESYLKSLEQPCLVFLFFIVEECYRYDLAQVCNVNNAFSLLLSRFMQVYNTKLKKKTVAPYNS